MEIQFWINNLVEILDKINIRPHLYRRFAYA